MKLDKVIPLRPFGENDALKRHRHWLDKWLLSRATYFLMSAKGY